ncbi:MAG: hypothetical protein ACXVBZ_08905 [Flavisolibacter sp.]
MNFLELKEQVEKKLINPFELLELHYTPYSFGSGLATYRIKGQIVKLVYDGKDDQVGLMVSERHAHYSGASFATIYLGRQDDFIAKGLEKLGNFNY